VETVWKAILQAGVFPTPRAFQQPVPLIRGLESPVDPIVGEGWVREHQDFLEPGMAHSLHGHVHGGWRGLIELVDDDEIGRNGLQADPRLHPTEIEKTVPDLLDPRSICFAKAISLCLGILINQRGHPPATEIEDIGFAREQKQDAFKTL